MKTSVAAIVLFASTALAQDREWVRDWESAQRQRPATIGSSVRIAPAGEPGTPMVVRGRVLQPDGKPAPGVIVFAYQTDRTGVYNAAGRRGWRLQGWARTDARGRFELHTIRPGSYPGSRNPAHIHVTIEGPGLPRRWSEEIQFADDPLIRDKGRPGVLPVTTRGGTQYVDYTIRIAESGRF